MAIWMMIILLQLVLVLVVAAAASPSPFSVGTVMCRPEERDALLSFKNAFSTNLDLVPYPCAVIHAKTESWKKNQNCCKWDGVTCDSRTGHVVKLDLSCSGLNGSFPANTTLVLLPRLRHLILANNFLSGQVPLEIGHLSHLTILILANNFLSGQVPLEIGWLSHLYTLDLSDNYQLKMHNFPTIIANMTHLKYLDLYLVNLASYLPPFIFNFSKLTYLGLSLCGLEGEFPISDVNTSTLSRVVEIDLSANMLTGTIPGWLFTRPSLEALFLDENLFTKLSEFEIGNTSPLTLFSAESNNLTGTILLSKILNFHLMESLFLSDNNLSIIDDIEDTKFNPSWPSFDILSLSSCNLGHFPSFLKEQGNLTWLELSNNKIYGKVPEWLLDIGTIQHLNLSHNFLHGGLEQLPWKNLKEIDIQNNLFHGVVPVPSSASFFWASSNHFSGAIPPSLCSDSELTLLDLAHNNLTGSIPECFASLIKNQLVILDLRQNQLHGPIPSSLFQECPNLEALSLSGNKLRGQIPQSINNCSWLQLLDLSSNNLSDKFPYWLGGLPSLKVLILSSNNLHGPLMVSNPTSSYPMLQILDISNNAFTSNLPDELLMSMKAMAKVDTTLTLSYMSSFKYRDSIVTWIKGVNRRLDAIYDKFVLIDASRNRLDGPIPDSIGDLISLEGLNLAHNNFTGHIPPSLSNLTMLESLDLSYNRLDGGVPAELVNLNSLAFFNVSENNLSGPVPTTKQFGTFSDPSYLGNPGLCGPWLTNKCGKPSDIPHDSTTSEGSGDELLSLQLWEIFLMGCGCGMFAGLFWGYIIFWMNSPYWLQWLTFQIETIVIGYQWRKRQNKRRKTKKGDTQGR